MSLDYLNNIVDWARPETVAVYDELPFWSAHFGQMMLRHIPMQSGSIVLDIGYGTGFPLLELAERLGSSGKVYGIDPWEAARQRAVEKARVWQVSNVEILIGDAAELPFPTEMFNLIISNLGINNFSHPEKVLRECARVARPSARLAITTNLKGHMAEFYTVYRQTLMDIERTQFLPALEQHISHRTTISEVTDLMKKSGFYPVKIVEEMGQIRFTDGSAMLRHHFIRQGFMDGWKSVVPNEDWEYVFTHLEKNLNRQAEEKGELLLTIPMAYIEGEK
jgi:arsenite methyltransferase